MLKILRKSSREPSPGAIKQIYLWNIGYSKIQIEGSHDFSVLQGVENIY